MERFRLPGEIKHARLSVQKPPYLQGIVVHHVDGCLPALAAGLRGHVKDPALLSLRAYTGMGLFNKALQISGHPVVSPRVLLRVAHALLHHRPVSLLREDEHVMVKLVPVLKRGVVHLGRHPAGVLEGFCLFAGK